MNSRCKTRIFLQVLGATFDAFKFPTSETVQFRALVTPCIPFCEPVVCNITDFSGQLQQTESYGRKKRSLGSSPNARVSRNQVVSQGQKLSYIKRTGGFFGHESMRFYISF